LIDPLRLDLLIKLLVATALGGVIGLERELSGKPAGLRTNILICVGAAIITDLSIDVAGMGTGPIADPGRIAAQIVTGIGFLGAGTIIQTRGGIHGLTSAATIWVVAAIGMLCGAGEYIAGIGSTVLVIVVLVLLGRFEEWVLERRRVRGSVRLRGHVPATQVRQILEESGIRIDSFEVRETPRSKVVDLRVRGSTSRLRSAAEELEEHDGVIHVDLD
jgi:putative Mg2+ transporter-C (MgtC) family protein